MWVHYVLCIHSSIGGHLGCFDLLTVVNGVAMNVPVQVGVGTLLSVTIHVWYQKTLIFFRKKCLWKGG